MSHTSSSTMAADICTITPNPQQSTPPTSQTSMSSASPASTPPSSSETDATKLPQQIQLKSTSIRQAFAKQNALLTPNIQGGYSSTPKHHPTSTEAQQNVTRGYTTHLPYNPSRPPPYTYQRQHEFPPFPPLTQHPVLPFLTTAFSSQQEPAPVVAPPPRPRPSLAPRASTTQRHVQSSVSAIPTMDVSKNDPTAIFIRPPLVVPVPPNVVSNVDPVVLNGADGQPAPGTPLTYAILHAHRNWFLDADHFRKDNPKKLDYPPELEPPRGWAPLNECTGAGAATRCKQAKEAKEIEKEKEKDKGCSTRTKGSYAQAETGSETVEYGPSDDCHEKTILRCTFCRREYHGPNAKSMWRRHVYDKHKVAMKNRREGSAGTAYRSLSKKGKPKTPSTLGPPLALSPPGVSDAPTLTLDLSKEHNLIRLLERVVAGNLNISLPSSVLGDGTTTVNLQSIASALQKSGITVTLDKEHNILTPETSFSSEGSSSIEDNFISEASSSTVLSPEPAATSVRDSRQSLGLPTAGYQGLLILDERSTITQSMSDITSQAQKRKRAEDPGWDRVPLKDNTIADRNQHNSNATLMPGTPRRDKGKQKAPRTPGGPRISQTLSPNESPTRNPFTPQRSACSTAMRAHALATTGQESYLTLVLSSPATASPVRSTGRVTFASPSMSRCRERPPTSDDHFGMLGASSPRYSFDFNISGSSPYGGTFDPIPLEVGSLALTPANWTPPSSLGPPAPVPESKSRIASRANSYGMNMDDSEEGSDMDPSSSPLKRVQRRRSSRDSSTHENDDDEDFDMDAFVDLKDVAPPISVIGFCPSPQKNLSPREFSKEFGLLSQEEVERIVENACPTTFEDEARSSKRRKADATP